MPRRKTKSVHAHTPEYREGYSRGYHAGKARAQKSYESSLSGLDRQVAFWRNRYDELKRRLSEQGTASPAPIAAVHDSRE